MSIGILGKKLLMTQLFKEDGTVVSVSVISAGPCPVVQVKDAAKDGYRSIQIGFMDKKESKTSKALLGHYKKANVTAKKYIREIRLSDTDPKYELGQNICVDVFTVGDYVDVVGTSIGKGFQGGMKRWHWKGGPGSHGSTTHRRAGSIGSSTTPGRVIRGHHGPGHMGYDTVTVQNLEVVQIDKDKNQMMIKGAVPGPENRLIIIKKALKKTHIKPVVAQKKSEKKEKTSAAAKSAGKKK